MRFQDGGAAFPRSASKYLGCGSEMSESMPQSGMSILDWFAGQALAGILASGHEAFSGGSIGDRILIDEPEITDALAFQHAKAMIEERFRLQKDLLALQAKESPESP